MAARISGIPELRHVAELLKEQGKDKTFAGKLRKGFNKAVKPLKEEIIKTAPRYLPDRYANALRRKIRVSVSRRGGTGSGARLHVKITARGRKDKRDIDRVDRGLLRHPVYGRHRFIRRGGSRVRIENPWVGQRVKDGFVTNPVREMAGQIVDATQGVIASITHEIEKG